MEFGLDHLMKSVNFFGDRFTRQGIETFQKARHGELKLPPTTTLYSEGSLMLFAKTGAASGQSTTWRMKEACLVQNVYSHFCCI